MKHSSVLIDIYLFNSLICQFENNNWHLYVGKPSQENHAQSLQ